MVLVGWATGLFLAEAPAFLLTGINGPDSGQVHMERSSDLLRISWCKSEYTMIRFLIRVRYWRPEAMQ